jgi:hypothetical protein
MPQRPLKSYGVVLDSSKGTTPRDGCNLTV